MGFQDFVKLKSRTQYKRLISCDKNVENPIRRFSKKMKGRLGGLRLSRSRKMTFRVFSLILFQSRIARIYANILKRIEIQDTCPTLIFCTQWGLPVVSHSSAKCRRNVISHGKPDHLSVRAF